MVEAKSLSPRQELLLRLIVKEHVETAATVASRTLVDQYDLDVSPATVRNDMAKLEDMGYLLQPHTSAGRIPTEAGFRYFVERLMTERALPRTEQRMIAHQFHQARQHLGAWLPLASSVLAKAAQAAAILTAPRTTSSLFKHVELIATHGRAVLLILVLEGGTVEQQMLVLSEPMTQESLREAADQLNEICVGLDAEQIRSHRRSSALVRVMEERSLLQAVLTETLTPSVGIGSIRVLIGGEGRWEELRTCSMVLARYGVANYATGTLGIVGPMRMHYGRAVSAVRFVASVLGELVYDIYQPNLNSDHQTNGAHRELSDS